MIITSVLSVSINEELTSAFLLVIRLLDGLTGGSVSAAHPAPVLRGVRAQDEVTAHRLRERDKENE